MADQELTEQTIEVSGDQGLCRSLGEIGMLPPQPWP